ncbi:hypothetical protein HY641_00610 [Candidatus Woesearchaeota archaeon]|nr:hypothetical protein [Candidatus Woesearchaeota archaeon]
MIPIAVIITIFIAIRLWLLWHQPVLRWDEAVYVAMGKYLWSGGLIGLWEPLRPILMPMIYGIIWKSGMDPIFIGHIIAIAFSSGLIAITYIIGRRITTAPNAILAALIIASTPFFWHHADALLTDIPAAVASLSALVALLQSRPLLAGTLAGTATLIRFPAGLCLLSLILITMRQSHHRQTDLARIIGGFLLTLIPFLAFNVWMYSSTYGAAFAGVHPFGLALRSQGNVAEWQPWYHYLGTLAWPTLWYVGAFVGMCIWHRNSGPWARAAITYLGVHIVYYASITNTQDRFLFAYIPIIAILATMGLSFTVTQSWARPLIAIGLIIGLLGTIHTLTLQTQWRAEPPDSDYLAFARFARSDVNATYLAANPVPAAYADARFIPYYDNVDSGIKEFDLHLNEALYIIHSPEAYHCPKDNLTCADRLLALGRKAAASGTEVFSLTHDGRNYHIYKTRA